MIMQKMFDDPSVQIEIRFLFDTEGGALLVHIEDTGLEFDYDFKPNGIDSVEFEGSVYLLVSFAIDCHEYVNREKGVSASEVEYRIFYIDMLKYSADRYLAKYN